MALDEAKRPVTVREGDKVSEIPAMQALFRAMFRAAAQGDTKAGGQLLGVIGPAESARIATAVDILQFSYQYKESYAPIFDKHAQEGLDPPDIYPHPDDVIINNSTGEVTIDGPMDKEHAGAIEVWGRQAMAAMRRYFEVEKALTKDPTNEALRREFKELNKSLDFITKEGARNQRHKVLRSLRLGPEAKPAESIRRRRSKNDE